jgi:hypothetical protein
MPVRRVWSKKNEGFVDNLYAHCILGRAAERKQTRCHQPRQKLRIVGGKRHNWQDRER